jgi:hypothetical protein
MNIDQTFIIGCKLALLAHDCAWRAESLPWKWLPKHGPLAPLSVWLSSGSVQDQFSCSIQSAPHVSFLYRELSLRLQGCQTSLHHVLCAHICCLKPAQCRSVLASSVDSDRRYGSATKRSMYACATRFSHLRSNTYISPSVSSQGLGLHALWYRRLAELGGPWICGLPHIFKPLSGPSNLVAEVPQKQAA